MPKLLDKKSIIRALIVYEHKKQLVVKIAPEGIYFKHERERWTSALFLPWMSGFTQAAIRRANEIREERKKKRQAKRLGA